MFNQSTDAVAQCGSGIPGFASRIATMTERKFIMAAGGWPIRLGGATVGGFGVSGGNAPGRDDEIARAGLAAAEAIAPATAAMPQAQRPSSTTPVYQSMPLAQPQSQVASFASSPASRITPANTYHLGSDQDNPHSDEQLPFDQYNEAHGEQT